jgi:hypothetical protein
VEMEPPSWNSLVGLPPGPSGVSYYKHAMRHALAIDDQADDTRLYLGPTRSADLLEGVAIVRDDGSQLVIHAMKMRPKYRRLLPEG